MICILTDSSSDLDPAEAARMGVQIIPMHLSFGDTDYIDRQTLSVAEFYEKLATVEKLPTTSQISPFQFFQAFRPHIEAGDDVVGCFLSSGLSGTFQNAQTALQMLQQAGFSTERIHLVDSLNAALGHYLLIHIAVRLRDAGHSAAEIAAQLTVLRKKTKLIACMKTMKFLVMGGRLSPAAAKIGSVLGITPIITLNQSGMVEVLGKVRGHKAALRWIQQHLKAEPADERYPVTFSHAVNPEGRDELIAAVDPLLPNKDYLFCDLGSTIGTHIGHSAIGYVYIAK